MDPVTTYRLGQIRHQELIDESARDYEGQAFGQKRGIAALFQRLRDLLTVEVELKQPTRTRTRRRATPLIISR